MIKNSLMKKTFNFIHSIDNTKVFKELVIKELAETIK